jgi:hypothetical protein
LAFESTVRNSDVFRAQTLKSPPRLKIFTDIGKDFEPTSVSATDASDFYEEFRTP